MHDEETHALERLADSGLIGKDDVVLVYGCGKGRVGFFLAYRTKATTIGIEYDERIYEIAGKQQGLQQKQSPELEA